MSVHGLLPAGGWHQAIMFDLVGLGMVGLALLRIGSLGSDKRSAWLLIGLGYVLFIGAEHGWRWLELVGNASAVAGLLLLVRRRMAGHMSGGLIDAAILTTAIAALSWTYVLRPLATVSDLDPLSTGQNLGFPAADLVLVAAVLTFLTTPGVRNVSVVLLGMSMLLVFGADQIAAIQLLNGISPVGGTADSLGLLAFALFAVATLHPSMPAVSERQPRAATSLGYARQAGLSVALIIGPILFLLGPDDPRTAVGVATGTMSVLVLLRLAGLVRLLEQDVAGRRVLEAKLMYQALHDPVTGLANRRAFVARAEAALAGRTEPGSIAALFIDLDDFKSINDTLGHAAGDEALAIVARRIQGALREGDVAARLGGDEFGVLVLGVASREDALLVSERIVAALARPLQLGSGPIVVGASIGAAIDRPGPGGVDELLGAADMAMYRAKDRSSKPVANASHPAHMHTGRGHVRAVRRDVSAGSVA